MQNVIKKYACMRLLEMTKIVTKKQNYLNCGKRKTWRKSTITLIIGLVTDTLRFPIVMYTKILQI
jgi:hypothetical protein